VTATFNKEEGSGGGTGGGGTGGGGTGGGGTGGGGGGLTVTSSLKFAGPPTVVVRHGKVTVKLSCVGSTTCTGRVTVTVATKSHKGRRTIKRTITVGSANVIVSAGQTKSISLSVAGTVRRLLAKSRSLKATLIAPNLRHALVLKRGR
jgi:hypothetical protein